MNPSNAKSFIGEEDRAESTIDRKLDRVNAQAHRLEDLISRAHIVLNRVLTPESPMAMAGGVSCEKAPSQSPLADELDSLAYRLERRGDELCTLLDRFEA